MWSSKIKPFARSPLSQERKPGPAPSVGICYSNSPQTLGRLMEKYKVGLVPFSSHSRGPSEQPDLSVSGFSPLLDGGRCEPTASVCEFRWADVMKTNWV